MISFIIRSGFALLFLSIIVYCTYFLGIKNYLHRDFGPEVNFLQILNESSSSKINTTWDDWFEVFRVNSGTLSQDPDSFDALTPNELITLEKLNTTLTAFNLAELQTYDYTIHEGNLWSLNFRDLRFCVIYNLKQILYLKSKDRSYDASVYLDVLFKIPIITERLSPNLLGKMMAGSMQRVLLEFCHTLYIQDNLHANEVKTIFSSLDYYLKYSSTLQETVLHELEYNLIYVRAKHAKQYIFSFFLQLFAGDTVAHYKNFMNNPKLLEWSKEEFHQQKNSLPKSARLLVSDFYLARQNVKRLQLYDQLLRCELDSNSKLSPNIKVNIVNAKRYCEMPTNFQEFENKSDIIVLKVFK
ncbi:MAG: hypothetical protein KC646_00255 [Candidatus Cloacimonetes bacterium]|nr:hypothetical protein [Candidatus Cloacimonadota bacterium]